MKEDGGGKGRKEEGRKKEMKGKENGEKGGGKKEGDTKVGRKEYDGRKKQNVTSSMEGSVCDLGFSACCVRAESTLIYCGGGVGGGEGGGPDQS